MIEVYHPKPPALSLFVDKASTEQGSIWQQGHTRRRVDDLDAKADKLQFSPQTVPTSVCSLQYLKRTEVFEWKINLVHISFLDNFGYFFYTNSYVSTAGHFLHNRSVLFYYCKMENEYVSLLIDVSGPSAF